MYEEKIKKLSHELRDLNLASTGKIEGLQYMIATNKKKYDVEVAARFKAEKRINKASQQMLEVSSRFDTQEKKIEDLEKDCKESHS